MLIAGWLFLEGKASGLEARGVSARVAAYTTQEPGAEAVLLATQYDAALMLLAAVDELLDGGPVPDELTTVLDQAPCDVALLTGVVDASSTGPIVTPFGGIDHDWSAIELGAWLAKSLGASLRLVGTRPTTSTVAATPAGYSPAPRFSSSRWSESSPNRYSPPQEETVFSKQRPTHGCS